MKDNNIHSQYLTTDGTDWNVKAMTTSIGTYYSDKIEARSSKGYAGLLVTTTAGSIAINQQVSINGVNFYEPVNSSDEDVCAVHAAITVGTKWVDFAPIVARYIRFKFVLTSENASVTAQYIQQE
jgi:hypothetical protein